MVERLAALYERHRDDLEARGINATLERNPDDGRDKVSAWLTLNRGETEGQITVWDGGECELWGPTRREEIPGTDPQAEHRQLDESSDLSAALDRLLALFD